MEYRGRHGKGAFFLPKKLEMKNTQKPRLYKRLLIRDTVLRQYIRGFWVNLHTLYHVKNDAGKPSTGADDVEDGEPPLRRKRSCPSDTYEVSDSESDSKRQGWLREWADVSKADAKAARKRQLSSREWRPNEKILLAHAAQSTGGDTL